MRYRLAFLACYLVSTSVFAEGFAIIQDPDGWVNVRESGSTRAEVIGRIDHGDLVWIFGSGDEDWMEVMFRQDGMVVTGFVHRSRVKAVSGLEKFPDGSEGEGRIVFQKGDLIVEIDVEPFDNGKGRFTKGAPDEGGGEWTTRIDGKPFYGTDGGMPSRGYRSIVIKEGDAKLTLPAVATVDLYQPSVDNYGVKIYRDAAGKALYVTAYNSDGAGGYVVAFRIVDGKYAGRLVLQPY